MRNRSAASKANNKSNIQENSVALPAISKKRVPTNPGVNSSVLEDDIIKDQLNRQHNKVEQEIKKYDEILKRNRNIRQHHEPERRKPPRVLQDKHNSHNQSQLNNDSQISASGKQLIGVYGVKLDNKHLDLRRGGKAHNESSVVLESKAGYNNKYRLPALVKLPSQPKGLLAKHLKLR